MLHRRIYLDYASLTPIDPRVLREMKKYSSATYANASSWYKEGVAAKNALDDARGSVASFIHAHADEVVFTSGGTESNGLALEGIARAAVNSGIENPHIIISSIEHSSVQETANMMEKHGAEVTRLPADVQGLISLPDLKREIKPNTVLISVMAVNNEIGSIQPIYEIAKIVKRIRTSKNNAGDKDSSKFPLFHTDAAQAALYEDLNMEKTAADLVTLDSSKLYGPRGVGALFIRRGTHIEPIIQGGGQESGIRSGTENFSGIMGFAKALDIVLEEREAETNRINELRNYFIAESVRIRPDIKVNGGLTLRMSPHILNVSIPGIDNEFFTLQLDAKGIACSTKSSCLRDEDKSYVLKAMGADSKTSVRFSFGRWTKKGDVRKTVKVIGDILSK